MCLLRGCVALDCRLVSLGLYCFLRLPCAGLIVVLGHVCCCGRPNALHGHVRGPARAVPVPRRVQYAFNALERPGCLGNGRMYLLLSYQLLNEIRTTELVAWDCKSVCYFMLSVLAVASRLHCWKWSNPVSLVTFSIRCKLKVLTLRRLCPEQCCRSAAQA